MAKTQYLVDIDFDESKTTELEADLMFRERMAAAFPMFGVHIGRIG